MSAPEPVAHVAVVVPVRDEEALLGRCLVALARARRELLARGGCTVDVVVVLDACRDASADVVARHGDVRVVTLDAGDVGAARRAGVRAALAAAPGDPARTWLAGTDADSEVRADWLVEHVRLADCGADVVVGTVHPDPADLTAAQWAAWRRTHVPGRPNGHVHGANLGVRASAYLRAGGFAPAAEHEDVDLVARLRATGARVVASDVVDVRTSGRPEGRTPGGYAGHLRTTLLRT
ncbi:glycosyltransferase [Cellulomonas phragmiteti]|uniref:4,4'-diaponeurosporenoate glycosyltransferase n=1 Tax=Cellulomonas phragmiteti TaxID=478780 RepID=A0ABQ4DRB4_9CELL|nr:glycosyltransferase family 2 protein [Cellulomonas phragmiteti]GIG41869.1 glycosyl transferase [Cellulomonas phragmiteti]